MNIKEKYDICVIGGCGRAGLPLALAFADQGQAVVIYDIDQASVEKINNQIMPFLEEGAPEVLSKVVNSKKLFATTEIGVISHAQNIIFVIDTPVDDHLNQIFQETMEVIKQITPYLNDNQLIVLRSTLYPGGTQRIYDYLRSVGKKVDVANCPERIAEGKALKELRTLPQIISAFDEKSMERAKALFSICVKETLQLSPMEAELAKLFSNAWRYLLFGISNQFYIITSNYGLDFYNIYEAMVKDYPRLQGFPTAGLAAGPCLFKDTMQLSAFSKNTFFMGHAAMLVNESLPRYLVEILKRKLSLKDKTVGILGMTFKANCDDARESLSFKLKKVLEMEAKEVLCSDVYILSPGFVNANELVERADLIVLCAPHREYKSLDLKNKPVLDMWNFFGKGIHSL